MKKVKVNVGTVLKVATFVLGAAGLVVEALKADSDKKEIKDELRQELLSEMSENEGDS